MNETNNDLFEVECFFDTGLQDNIDINYMLDDVEKDDEAFTRWKLFTFFLLDPDEQGRLV